MTIGEDEDDKAFDKWIEAFYIAHPQFPDELSKAARQSWLMRYAFDGGMERGEEKRGCCHEHDPETVAVAIAREAEDAL